MLNAGLPPLAWGPCAEARAFFVRASTLPHNYCVGYNALIRQLIQANIWTKLDALYVFATYDTTNALLNLKSASFPCTVTGAPTFTRDRGYAGADLTNALNYLNTGFNPTTATNPAFTQNSAHLSAWIAATFANANGGGIMGVIGDAAAAGEADIFVNLTGDGLAYFRANDTQPPPAAVTPPATTGSFISSRTASGTQTGYVNGIDQVTGSVTSATVANANITILARNDSPAAVGVRFECGQTVAAASIGGGLTASDAAVFHGALRQFMTQRGVTVP